MNVYAYREITGVQSYIYENELVNRGVWSSTTPYLVRDMATIGTARYICLTANTGMSPTLSLTHWTLLIIVRTMPDPTPVPAPSFLELSDTPDAYGSVGAPIRVAQNGTTLDFGPLPQSFWATYTAQTTLVDDDFTILKPTTIVVNTGGFSYNSSTGVFTVALSGLYDIEVSLPVSSSTVAVSVGMAIFANPGVTPLVQRTGFLTGSVASRISLLAGTNYVFFAFQGSGAPLNSQTTNSSTSYIKVFSS